MSDGRRRVFVAGASGVIGVRIHVDAAARRAFEAMDAKGVVIAVDEA